MNTPANNATGPVNPSSPVIGVGGFAAASILSFLQNNAVLAQLQQEFGTMLENQTTATVSTMAYTMNQGESQARAASWQSYAQAIGYSLKTFVSGFQFLRSNGVFNSGLKDLMGQANDVSKQISNLEKYKPLFASTPGARPANLVGEDGAPIPRPNLVGGNQADQNIINQRIDNLRRPGGFDLENGPQPNIQLSDGSFLSDAALGNNMWQDEFNDTRANYDTKMKELRQQENSIWTQINSKTTTEGQLFNLATSAVDTGTQAGVAHATYATQHRETLKNYLSGLNQLENQILQSEAKMQDAAVQQGDQLNAAINALGK